MVCDVEGEDGDEDVDDSKWNVRADPALCLRYTCSMWLQGAAGTWSSGGISPLPCALCIGTTDYERKYHVMDTCLASRERTRR